MEPFLCSEDILSVRFFSLGNMLCLFACWLRGGDSCRATRYADFVDEGLVDVRDDTSPGDCCLDEGVKLLVASDGEKEMPGCDAFHLQIFTSVPCELEYLGC